MRILVAALFSVCLIATTVAASPKQPFSYGGVTVSKDDSLRFLDAMQHALTENDTTIPLILTFKKASEMPAYDPVVHYAGIQPAAHAKPNLSVWANGEVKEAALQGPLTSSFALAVCDGGYAGPAFKKFYDTAAAQDAALGPSVADPFQNRHRLGAALVAFITGP